MSDKKIGQEFTQQEQQVHHDPSDNYFALLDIKKREMSKVVVYAMMILLALLAYTIIDFAMKEAVAVYDLTFKQELFLKILFPIVLFFVIWNIKVFA